MERKMSVVEQRIIELLNKRFPASPPARTHYGELLVEYFASGLAPPHLVSEIETTEEGKFWSYTWEAMLFRHLRSRGYALSSVIKASGQQGPDFRIDHQGRAIWIEAIVPSPEGIPAQWLEAPRTDEVRVKTKPHEQMLLRCTSAINDKRKKFAEYVERGVVKAGDTTVIALNICRLSDWDVDGRGISRLPFVVEAVFPIGPIVMPIGRDGKASGPARHSARFVVKKANRRDVPTDSFLDPRFATVSAVLQAFQKDMLNRELILSTTHNPLATTPMQTGLFGVSSEFVATKRGDEYELQDIASKG